MDYADIKKIYDSDRFRNLTEQQQLAIRVLCLNPDMTNTEGWLRMQINSERTSVEVKRLCRDLLKHIKEMIPVGSMRALRRVRQIAEEVPYDHPLKKLLPSEPRQDEIDDAEELYHLYYSDTE